MDRPTPPRPDSIREPVAGFSWIDHRIRDFWEDFSHAEFLLYFFLITVSNKDGCSWYPTRKIAKILKLGPASVISARKNLQDRGLIATKKDTITERQTIYQVLPLPVVTSPGVPIRVKIDKKNSSRSSPSNTANTNISTLSLSDFYSLPEPQHKRNIENINTLREFIKTL